MRALLDYLSVRTPLIGLVHPDLRWSRSLVWDTLRALESGPAICLEFTAAHGWRGPADILAKMGLSATAATARGSERRELCHAVAQFESLLRVAADQPESTRHFPLQGGTVILHDIAPAFDSPVMVRTLLELPDLLQIHDLVAIVPMTVPLAAGHPLHGALVQVSGAAPAVVRYGDMVRAFIEQFGAGRPGASVDAIAAVLEDLPGLTAETVLRLAALDVVRETVSPETPLVDIVVRARQDGVLAREPAPPAEPPHDTPARHDDVRE